MNAVVKPVASSSASKKVGSNANEDLQGRQSQELIFGLSGPVGSGIQFVINTLEEELKARGYEVVHIKVSTLLESEATRQSVNPPAPNEGSDEFKRIWRLQDLGNGLRNKLGEDIGAQLAIRAISTDRTARHPGQDIREITPGRIAYIIDQLKHPREVELLKSVYGNLFYLLGVLSGYERRKGNLLPKMSADFAERLIHRDRSESDKKGQQLDRTLKLADYFIRNSHHNTALLRAQVERLLGLIHGDNKLTPTRKEKGMYAAFSAALQSACLSRQVGAAIVDRDGNIIATGCNDVPKAGGGLYEAGSSGQDHRCAFLENGTCYNDQHKDMLRDQFEKVLKDAGASASDAQRFANAIRQNTGIKDLIEFSRAVHAEMDAIIKVSRKGGASVSGSFLFTTTYPCHNCARHIVAAGIRAVYFIEPYEKSLASQLHSDAIEHEPENEPAWGEQPPAEKVAFLHFEGVSPTRFAALFMATEDRKDDRGKAIHHLPMLAGKRSPEFLDNYKDLEARVIGRLDKLGVAGEQSPLIS